MQDAFGATILNLFAELNLADLEQWIQQARSQAASGRVADRIPLLAKAQPDEFALCIDGEVRQVWGSIDRRFVLMSAIKPFVLLQLLQQVGAKTVFGWVGTEASDAPFNSLVQLTLDRGQPRNPMINSGAIVLADKLPGKTAGDRCENLRLWLNHYAGCKLTFDAAMLASVQSAGRVPNQAIVQALTTANRLDRPQLALETYEQICCLSANVQDLARLGLLLALPQPQIQAANRAAVNALMLTCGLYEASGAYAVRIGLPIKSGISGALLATIPGRGAIACYSPALDSVGNPVVGLALIETIARELNLSIFA
ncbi:glutaminase [Microcoleus sp. FACHB-1515]|nr:glutaminase [Microcoleus sp. FACHB-1515]